jgi:two-component system, NarL family, nitrate/nitrite response regulator NarL
MVRRSLRQLLEDEYWVEEVFEAWTVGDAVREAVTNHVDLVVMDLFLKDSQDGLPPDENGIDATRKLRAAAPDARVLVFTYAKDQALASQAIDAGARGYVVKDAAPETVLQALHSVALDLIVYSFGIDPRAHPCLPAPFDQLPDSSLRILDHLCKGGTNAQIGRAIGLSEKTVRNQLTAIYARLGVTSRLDAVSLAQKAGFPRR